MGIKIKFILIIGEARMTRFMQAADMFEKSKVLGDLHIMTIEMKAEEKHVSFTQCQRLVNYMAKNFPKQYNLSLIHLDSIIYDDRVMLNTKLKCQPYINREVRVISFGHKWRMFHEYLKQLNIPYELDERCFIK